MSGAASRRFGGIGRLFLVSYGRIDQHESQLPATVSALAFDLEARCAISLTSTEARDLDKNHMKSWIWSLSFLCRSKSINSCRNCFVNFTSCRPESLRSGLSGLRMFADSKLRRLMMTCSFDGMNPFDRARNIWYECSFW